MTGRECRPRREALGWLQKELADRAGLAESCVSAFEHGQSAGAPETIRRIEAALRGEAVAPKKKRKARGKTRDRDWPPPFESNDRELMGT